MPTIPFRKKKPTVPLTITKADAKELINRSQYAQFYYPETLKHYYPEIHKQDFQLALNNPETKEKAEKLLSEIHHHDEKERMISLVNTELDAKQDYYKLKPIGVAVPIVGAGSITFGLATLFGGSLASLFGVTLATLLWPVGIVAAIGAVGFIGYSLYNSHKDKEQYIRDRVKQQALGFQIKHLENNPTPDPTVLQNVQQEKLSIDQRVDRMEDEREFKRLNPKNSLQKMILGATAGAAVGGFAFPLIPFITFGAGISVVLGVLLGVGVAAAFTEIEHRVRRHFYLKNETGSFKANYLEHERVKKGEIPEHALEKMLKSLAKKQEQPSQPSKDITKENNWVEKVTPSPTSTQQLSL